MSIVNEEHSMSVDEMPFVHDLDSTTSRYQLLVNWIADLVGCEVDSRPRWW